MATLWPSIIQKRTPPTLAERLSWPGIASTGSRSTDSSWCRACRCWIPRITTSRRLSWKKTATGASWAKCFGGFARRRDAAARAILIRGYPAIKFLVAKQRLDPFGNLSHFRLGNRSLNPHALRFLHHVRRNLHGTQQDRQMRFELRHFPRRLKAVHARHHQIENQHIGMQFAHALDRFPSPLGLSTNLPVAVALDELAQRATHHRVIVGNKDSDSHHHDRPVASVS